MSVAVTHKRPPSDTACNKQVNGAKILQRFKNLYSRVKEGGRTAVGVEIYHMKPLLRSPVLLIPKIVRLKYCTH